LFAGTWYPQDPAELLQSINCFFEQVKSTPIQNNVYGLISPHAGHYFSGLTAATGYSNIPEEVDLVVIISPAHKFLPGKYNITDCSFYSTPLGKIAVDSKIVELLSQIVPLTTIKKDTEHAIEIHLPFLQTCLDDFTLLPIMIGHDDIFDCEDIISALLKICDNRKVMYIASSDLYHIDDYQEVHDSDNELMEALENLHVKQLYDILNRPNCSVCGKLAIMIVIEICLRLGADTLSILDHRTSGDITQNKQAGVYTVGYLSAAISKKNDS